MKPIETTKQDQFGHGRMFVIRRDEAYTWAALMGGKVDDSRPVQKHTYDIGQYPQPAYSLSMQAWRHCRNQRRKETPWQG